MSLEHDLAQNDSPAAPAGAPISTETVYSAVQGTAPERVSRLARRVLETVQATIREESVTYDEYHALMAWLDEMGAPGEWPLFLAIWLEHAIEEVATSHRAGSKGTIEGPFYIPNAPERDANGSLPMRENERGVPLTFAGTVTSTDGRPLDGSKIEIWHGDTDGNYSQFAPGLPEWNLRGTFTLGADGAFRIRAIQPGPYQVPTDGACGKLIRAAGWHAWRPAHLHVKVTAPGFETLISQLYFPGDPHNDDDVASAVKPELMLDPVTQPDGTVSVNYDFVLDPLAA